MRCKYFKLQELVPQRVYQQQGEEAWKLLDERLLAVLDWLRELVGTPLIVNTWSFGGVYQYRGWRPASCRVGAKRSRHKRGLAADLHSPTISAEIIRKMIADNAATLPYPIRLERNVAWVHVDVDNDGSRSKIVYFNP